MNHAPALLSRSLDPILGVFTGVLAFYMHETNPRTAPPSDESLLALAQWKREKWNRARVEKEEAESEAQFRRTVEELVKEDGTKIASQA
ncbi:hypothetical protein DFH11DRAFT_1131624 [Phellopilus nigrolimitatus]|nr:hypothetical protein DFH11DRAFT_1131624 [Phellopilus nigrolimitatus]